MIYLYGITDDNRHISDEFLTSLDGVTGNVRIAQLSLGGLIYGDSDEGEIRAKRKFLLRHTKILEEVNEKATVLPMRFGMFADSIEHVSELVTENSSLVMKNFEKLSDSVEYGLKVEFGHDATLQNQLSNDKALSEEHYRLKTMKGGHFQVAEFGRKLGEAVERKRTNAQRALLSLCKNSAEDIVVRPPENEYQVLNAFVLLRKGAEEDFLKSVEDSCLHLGFGKDNIPTIRFVGPSPAFNFVNLSLTPVGERAA